MIVVIDYGMGNLHSAFKAFEHLGADVLLSGSPADLRAAEKLVLPGVGAFGDGMENLNRLGLSDAMREEVLAKKKPILGICLGMQLLAKDSSELGMHEGLGFIDAHVRKLPVNGIRRASPSSSQTAPQFATGLKLPHVGWNNVKVKEGARLFEKVSADPSFYFVHSFAVECNNPADVAATCEYGKGFAAALQHENIFATQFHPEKSQKDGLRILQNFIEF